MDQRLHFVTVATVDLDAARRFYTDGLGWTPLFDAPGEIVFYQVAPGMVLGLFDAASFDQDLGRESMTRAVSGLTLSHNVDTRDAVTTTMAALRAAGGTIITPARDAEFGEHSAATSPIRMGSSGRSRTLRDGASTRTGSCISGRNAWWGGTDWRIGSSGGRASASQT